MKQKNNLNEEAHISTSVQNDVIGIVTGITEFFIVKSYILIPAHV